MAKFTYTTPTAEDMREIARMMRPEDRREIVGLIGPNIETEANYCVESSECAYVCKCDGVPLAAFGVVRQNPFENVGVIWMLATKETAKHKVYTGKWTRRGIRAFLNDWDFLYNYVDEGNDRTIAWLKWLGAKVYPAAPYGIYGLPYHKFTFGEVE